MPRPSCWLRPCRACKGPARCIVALTQEAHGCMQGLDAAPVAFVDTLPALQAAAARLAASRELAVDLEDHSYRSYQARAALPYPCSRAQARGRLGRVCPCVPLRRGLVSERGLAASDVRILVPVCRRMVQQPSFSCVRRTFEHPCARMYV